MSTATIIRVRYLSGADETIDATTPVYVESYSALHAARSDDGSMQALSSVVPAGTVADPDTMAAGRDLTAAMPYTYYIQTEADIVEPIEILSASGPMDGARQYVARYLLDRALVTAQDATDLRADLEAGTIDRTDDWDLWTDMPSWGDWDDLVQSIRIGDDASAIVTLSARFGAAPIA